MKEIQLTDAEIDALLRTIRLSLTVEQVLCDQIYTAVLRDLMAKLVEIEMGKRRAG